jgi:uncharacterized protein
MKFCISKINEKRINYNLNTKKMLPETSRDQTICHWVADIRRDPLFKTIIASAPFQRLADISFMGAIDYLSMAAFLNKEPRTRFAHSLGVAGLANFISIKRNYSRELRKHLIAASLLHDIGHAPLSHSVEPYLKESLGLDHHEIGAMIINGKVESSRSLNEYLQSNFDLGFIRSLIDRVAPDSDGGDLFSDKINIDTIDGIIRACECYLNYSTVPDRLDVARAAFFPDTEERLSVLEIFWGLKNIVYKDLVHSATSVLADSFSSSYLKYLRHFLSLEDVLQGEQNWRRRYARLFDGLSSISRDKEVFARYAGTKAAYNARDYWVDESAMGNARFQVRVEKKFYSVEGFQ